jgi:DNA-binding NarL/FixJ family response regulator
VPQLKLLEVEAGGYTYTLSRLRPLADDNLTDRQKQIAWLVSEGLSNKGIAAKLRISPATVAAHLRTIFTKLRVKTRTALAKHARAYYG